MPQPSFPLPRWAQGALLLLVAFLHTAVADWTILVYMNADNNLECFGMEDMSEMLGALSGAPEPPNVFVMADRGPETCSRYIDREALPNRRHWSTAKDLLVGANNRLTQIADHGEISMDNPTQLANFIERGVKAYPADKYMLIFWDHGAGWPGFGGDEQCSGSQQFGQCHGILTLENLDQGIKAGMEQANLTKFDILGFDACLMATYEVVARLGKHADYYLASEELEPGHGWNYQSLDILKSSPDASPTDLAKSIQDGFLQQAQDQQTTCISLALVDISKWAAFETAHSSMIQSISALLESEDNDAITKLSQARAQSLEMLPGYAPNERTGGVDHGLLLSLLTSLFGGEVSTKARAALDAYNAVVTYFVNDSLMQRGTGLSVYWPNPSYLYVDQYDTLTTVPVVEWRTLLKEYWAKVGAEAGGGFWYDYDYDYSGGGAFSFSTASALPVTGTNDQGETTWTLTGEISSSATTTPTLADLYFGWSVRQLNGAVKELWLGQLAATIDSSTISGTWDGEVWGIFQGSQAAPMYSSYVTVGSSGEKMVQVPVAYSEASCDSNDWKTGTLHFPEASGANFQLFVENTMGEAVTMTEVRKSSGGVFMPYLYSKVTGGNSTISSGNGPDCFCAFDGRDYGGTASSTAYGQQCVEWTMFESFMQQYPGMGLAGGHNHCRNPDGDSNVWCFTGDDGSWDYCNVTRCDKEACDPTAYDLNFDYSACIKWSEEDAVQVMPAHIAGISVEDLGVDLSSFLPADVNKDLRMQIVAMDAVGEIATLGSQSGELGGGGGGGNGGGTGGSLYDISLGGCTCHNEVDYYGYELNGCSNPDNDPNGEWCFIDESTCTGIPAVWFSSEYSEYGNTWDYCQLPSRAGCHCTNAWEFNGEIFRGTCGNPDNDPGGDWCLIVEGSCTGPSAPAGLNWDYCGPASPRLTLSGEPCILPFEYGNVTYHDCTFTNDTDYWCFTSDDAWGYCDMSGGGASTPTSYASPPPPYPSPDPYCSGETQLYATSTAQTFTDGSPTSSQYAPYSYCEWLITPSTPGAAVELTLTRLDTETTFDKVQVFDETGSNWYFEEYSGGRSYSLPMVIGFTSTVIRVLFESDYSIQGTGFAMEYKQIEYPSPPPPYAPASECTTNYVEFRLNSGGYPSEVGWTLSSWDGRSFTMLFQFVPPEDLAQNEFLSTYKCLPDGFYALELMDSYGDGWNGAYLKVTDGINDGFILSATIEGSDSSSDSNSWPGWYSSDSNSWPGWYSSDSNSWPGWYYDTDSSNNWDTDSNYWDTDSNYWDTDFPWWHSWPDTDSNYYDSDSSTDSNYWDTDFPWWHGWPDWYGDTDSSSDSSYYDSDSSYEGGMYRRLLEHDSDTWKQRTTVYFTLPAKNGVKRTTCSDSQTQVRAVLSTPLEGYAEEIYWGLANLTTIAGDSDSDSDSDNDLDAWNFFEMPGTYSNGDTYTYVACLPDAQYFLFCLDTWDDGWHGGYMTLYDSAGSVIAYCEPDGYSTTNDDYVVFTIPYVEQPPPPRSPPPPAPYCAPETVREGQTSGSISDGSPQNERYMSNSYCGWLISVADGSRIVLTLTALNLESGYDFLEVYDSLRPNGDPLISWSGILGDQRKKSVTSYENVMYLLFHSDSSVEYDGFTVTYAIESAPPPPPRWPSPPPPSPRPPPPRPPPPSPPPPSPSPPPPSPPPLPPPPPSPPPATCMELQTCSPPPPSPPPPSPSPPPPPAPNPLAPRTSGRCRGASCAPPPSEIAQDVVATPPASVPTSNPTTTPTGTAPTEASPTPSPPSSPTGTAPTQASPTPPLTSTPTGTTPTEASPTPPPTSTPTGTTPTEASPTPPPPSPPPPSPSPPPPSPSPPPPSPPPPLPPPPPPRVIAEVKFVATFPNLDLNSIQTNSEYKKAFETDYKDTLAQVAKVTPDRVEILNYFLGSVKVNSKILMDSEEETTELFEKLSSSPELLQSESLESYGQAVIEDVQLEMYASPPPPRGSGIPTPPSQPGVLYESTSLGNQITIPIAFLLAVVLTAADTMFWW